jgi:hypothetical protein
MDLEYLGHCQKHVYAVMSYGAASTVSYGQERVGGGGGA